MLKPGWASLRTVMVGLSVCAILLTTTVMFTVAQATPETPVTEPAACPYTDPVQLVWFYKPPDQPASQRLINNFNLYVLTKGDEALLETLNNADEHPILQYVHFDSIHDPCHQAELPIGTPCKCNLDLLRNQVGWFPADICWMRDNHPEWFLRDSSGKLMYDNDQVMIDPGNADWQKFWIERVSQSQPEGWDGVFLDNVATRFGVHRAEFVELQAYPTADDYRKAVVSFLKRVYEDYFVPNQRLLYANISIYTAYEDDDTFLEYLPYLDGVMDEFWAYPRTDYYSVESWDRRLWRMEQVIGQGKAGVMVAQGERDDFARQRFGLATYLLLSGDHAYFRYTSDQGSYRSIWTYGNYKWNLGEPLGEYTREGNVWSREFSNGKVTVDVENQKASIELYDQSEACLPK